MTTTFTPEQIMKSASEHLAAQKQEEAMKARGIYVKSKEDNLNRVHKKIDGYLLIAPDGDARFLGFWESLGYRLFKRIPKA